MNFNLSEDQQAIRDVVDRMFADLCADDRIKTEYASETPMHRELWAALAEAGLLGASLPESVGGSGLGFTETCLLLEAQGRSVAPLPLLQTVVECALPLARHAAGNTLVAGLLEQVCSGGAILAPVRPYEGLRRHQPLSANAAAGGLTLTGVSASAAQAPLADFFLISCDDSQGEPVVALLATDTDGITRTDQRWIGGDCAGSLSFTAVPVPAEAVIARGAAARTFSDDQAALTATALAAQQVGVLAEGLARTAAYDNERKQFGRSLSSFQAVAHQAADAYMEIEALRGVYWRALDDIDHDRDATLSAHAAKYWCCRAGHRVAHTVMHLHGGMGQDLEYPIHRFFTWAKRNERYRGTAPEHSRALGACLAEPASRKVSAAA